MATEMRPIRNSRMSLVMHMRVKTTHGRLARLPENRVKYPDAVSIVHWKESRGRNSPLKSPFFAAFSRSLAKTFFSAASLNSPLSGMRTYQNPAREFYSLILRLSYARNSKVDQYGEKL
jgi:hypothetical protein